MSTSLNVVSSANVFWESFNRVATRFLSLVIGTCMKADNVTNAIRSDKNFYGIRPIGENFGLTRLSLSLGGSWGSVAPGLGGGGPTGFVTAGFVSTLGAGFSFFSSAAGDGGGGDFSDGFSSEGAT